MLDSRDFVACIHLIGFSSQHYFKLFIYTGHIYRIISASGCFQVKKKKKKKRPINRKLIKQKEKNLSKHILIILTKFYNSLF